ncbi:MAG TPA: cytochrome c oxidase subunit 3, partial [Pirellulales bacterium]|nr:cytochrome c oxidase subunit 3 [Pirellulales bacterium]
MNPKPSLLTDGEREMLAHTALHRSQLEHQFANLEQQHQAASTAMWVFLATEVMFFGVLFATLGLYHILYAEAFERASARLNWLVGGLNTLILLVSSFLMALAVRSTKLGQNRQATKFLLGTAALGALFLVCKGYEYYTDYQENLIPGWRFDPTEWTDKEGLRPEQVPHVTLFLFFYWVTTPLHALHVTIGIGAVLLMALLARRSLFTPHYYSPVEV